MKRMTFILMTLALVLGLVQCKKEQPEPQSERVKITLNLENGHNGSKAEVDPPHVNFVEGDQILVAYEGKYVGYLQNNGTNFSGTIDATGEGAEPLYFYFLGNCVDVTGLTAGSTTSCEAVISDQTGYPAMPVISFSASYENYYGEGTYTARLQNKASLMKFNVTTPSDSPICITGMNNKVTVNFADRSSNDGFSYGMNTNDGGLIRMAGGAGVEKWAIVLPQTLVNEGEAYTEDGIYTGTRPAIEGGIEMNKYYHEGDDVVSMTLDTYTEKGNPLTFKVLTNGTVKVNSPMEGMQYTLNGSAKTTMSGTTTIDVVFGDTVRFYGNGTNITSYNGTRIAGGTAQVKAFGNIMSLIDETGYATLTTLPNQSDVFFELFKYNSTLIDASGLLLPATTLADNCYASMFSSCISLTIAPELPATTLADNCYASMFYNCTSLTTAPELPATTLANSCYNQMFYGCSSLTIAPELPATTLADNCYSNMFKSCTSLTTVPELPATTLAYECYKSMFSNCSGLTTAPELPATTLADRCYGNMFYYCTSLTTAPELPATTLANYCYSYMFGGCTSLTAAPELPATTLAIYCYSNMFNGCSSLNSMTCMATDISASYCTNNWLNNVATTGTFTTPSTTNWNIGVNGIPIGWTRLNPDGSEWEAPAAPIGVINSLFSVSATQKVYFAQGNLQYIGSAGNGDENNTGAYWKFADNQWDYFGSSTGQNSSNKQVDRDLFGWGTSGYNHGAVCYQPWNTSTTNSQYYAYGNSSISLNSQTGQADWGYNAISNGGNEENSGWRTLTTAEWNYVINNRSDADSKKGHAKVNGVNGVILLPDLWVLPEGLSFVASSSSWAMVPNVYDAEQWAQMEAHGAVFLPAAGYRTGTILYNVGSYGSYWRSSVYYGDNAYRTFFSSATPIQQGANYRCYGNSVRLVRNAE